ncbi:efflux RND transporter periplasmic adaptor subunit [Lactococcus petauri]|uniref:efflux RND transporter periplasmic adaptor subunit n=1 Tax=Lactococcus petauri TaxID=1940789 RepID=UPI0038538926
MPKRKKKMNFIIVLVISFIGILGALFFYLISNKNDEKSIPTALSVKKIVEESQGDTPQLTGEVIPNAMSKINVDSSKGIIDEVYVKVGDKVKKGQKLFSYNNPENNQALKEGEAEIAKLQNKVQLLNQTLSKKTAQLESKYEDVNKMDERLNNLGGSEKEDLEQKLKILNEEVQSIELEIETLKSEQSDAQLDLDKSQSNQDVLKEKKIQENITSSVDGIVKKIDGEQVNTSLNSGAQTGSFMEIMDTSSIKVEGKVDELRKDKILVGQSVSIIDRKNQEKIWKGKINRIDDIATESEEESTLSKYPFEALIEVGKEMPHIGSHVFVIPEKLKEKDLNIPSSFILKEKDKSYIWKVKNGKAMKQYITIGKIDKASGKTEIKKGVTLEDQILVPSSKLSEGMEVSHD